MIWLVGLVSSAIVVAVVLGAALGAAGINIAIAIVEGHQ